MHCGKVLIRKLGKAVDPIDIKAKERDAEIGGLEQRGGVVERVGKVVSDLGVEARPQHSRCDFLQSLWQSCEDQPANTCQEAVSPRTHTGQ